MKKEAIRAKIDYLLIKSPSVYRIGAIIWPLRIISFILGPLCMIGSIVYFLLATSAFALAERFGGSSGESFIYSKIASEIESYGSGFLSSGLLAIFTGIVFLIIAWLTGLVADRNTYVTETQEMLKAMKNDLAAADTAA